MTTENTAYGTYTAMTEMCIRDSRYLSTADYKAAGRTALVPTGYVGTGENIRLTITPTGTTTAGAGTLRVQYVIANRAEEVNPG